MNPKEKALELKQKFGIATMFSKDNNGYTLSEEMATKMAIIVVDEIIDILPSVNGRPPNYQTIDKYCSEYWQQVKNELSK